VLVNLGIIGAVSYVAYDNWDQPNWDGKTVSAVTVGLLALVAGEGYEPEVVASLISALTSISGSWQSSTKRKNTRRGGECAEELRLARDARRQNVEFENVHSCTVVHHEVAAMLLPLMFTSVLVHEQNNVQGVKGRVTITGAAECRGSSRRVDPG
jgi:hypothetical protein